MFFFTLILFCIQPRTQLMHLLVSLVKALPLSALLGLTKSVFVSSCKCSCPIFFSEERGGCLNSNCSMQIHGWFGDSGVTAPWGGTRCPGGGHCPGWTEGSPCSDQRSPRSDQQCSELEGHWLHPGSPSTPPWAVTPGVSQFVLVTRSSFSLCPSGHALATLWPGTAMLDRAHCPAVPGDPLRAEHSPRARSGLCRVEPDQAICMTDCNS